MLFFPRLTTIQTIGCLALTGAILVPAAVHADVVLLKNGQRVEGVATQTPGKPDSVTIRGPKGTVELSKDLIQTIQYESEAVNLRRTGDDHYNAKRYKEAIESYQKSLALDPKDELTAKQLKTAQDAIARESTVERRKQIEVINTTLAEAKKKVATKEFDAAEKMLLKEVPALTPTDEQVQQSNEIKRDLYLAWAHESDDKLKPELAVKYYEKVLELDASNKEAYERLIKVMETNPDYNQRVIEAYRVQLKLTPDDSATRRKLADKLLAEGVRMERTATLDPTEQKKVDDELKEAVDTFQLCIPAGIEERKSLVADPMSQALERLYKRAEGRGDFAEALTYYQRLAKVSDKTSNQTALDLRYRAEVKKIIPDNSYVNLAPETVDQLVALSQRAATEWKVEALSRETFSNLKKRYPEQPSVIAAQKAMADIILTSASNAQHELDYDKAMKLSTECLREYGSIPGVKDRAEQIYNLSKVEAEKRAVVTAGNAKQLKEDGDVARQEGIASAQLIARTDRDKNVTAVNPAADALSAFKRAQEKYQKALAAVGNDAELKADINKMLVDVQARMNNLTGQAKKFYK